MDDNGYKLISVGKGLDVCFILYYNSAQAQFILFSEVVILSLVGQANGDYEHCVLELLEIEDN